MGYRYNVFSGEFDYFLEDSASGGDFADQFDTDSGSAFPALNILDIVGDATQGISTSGSGSTVSITIDDATTTQKGVAETSTDAESIAGTSTSVTVTPSSLSSKLGTQIANSVPYGLGTTAALGWTSALTDGQLVIGATGAIPAAANLTSSGGSVTITNSTNSINLEAGSAVPTSFPTDSGTATPAAGLLTVAGGTGINTSGAASTVTINLDSPVLVANGGTGSTSFTAGSVVFSNGSILTQDNAKLFWDDTNNRLGIGTTTPLDSLHVVDGINLVHTAAEADDHALEINCDAAGFGDVKALDINYITGAIGAGDDEEAMLVNIDESLSTGGEISGYQILTTEEGSATIHGYTTGININPILHNSGTFGDIDDILNKAVDVTAALASGGAGSISAFVADNDTMTFGDAAEWNEMEFILGTGASGAGIAPTFEFSTGGAGFTAFSPSDGTNGMRNSGAMLWIADDLIGWATNASGLFEIRITRTRNTLSTTPILDEVQLSATTEYMWDKNGDVTINSLTLSTALTVPNGGTGLATITDGGILLGSGVGAITVTAQPTNGQLLIGSTGVDPVLGSLASSGATVTITAGAGTINLETSTSVATSYTTDSGSAVPAAGVLSVLGTGLVDTSGATSVVTINVDSPVVVANGGTGLTSTTAYAVLCGGTTTTAALQSIASVGTANQVLTSNGAGALPTFQASGLGPQVITLTALTNASTPYTALLTGYYYTCDVSGGVLSILLPNAPTTGRVFIVKDAGGDAATNNITVTTVTGAVTLDGATTFVMNTAYESANFVFNGVSYEVY